MDSQAGEQALPTRLRCGMVLMAKPGLNASEWEGVIKNTVAELGKAAPWADVHGLVTIASADDEVHSSQRALSRPIDATIALTFSADREGAALLGLTELIKRCLDNVVDPAGCHANIGTAYYPTLGYGAFGYTAVVFRDAQVTESQFWKWWFGHHSKMGLESPAAPYMVGYSLQHRADPVTSKFNELLGFSDKGDLFEQVYIDNLDGWTQAVTQATAESFYEDEKGFVSRDGPRMATQTVVATWLAEPA